MKEGGLVPASSLRDLRRARTANIEHSVLSSPGRTGQLRISSSRLRTFRQSLFSSGNDSLLQQNWSTNGQRPSTTQSPRRSSIPINYEQLPRRVPRVIRNNAPTQRSPTETIPPPPEAAELPVSPVSHPQTTGMCEMSVRMIKGHARFHTPKHPLALQRKSLLFR